jgi:putative ABC transport system permease protein
MLSGQPVLHLALIIVCVIMAITAGLVYWVAAFGSPWTVPWAAFRTAVQLAAALTRLWSSMLVLAVVFVVASVTAARRSQASRGSALLVVSLAPGLVAVLPLLPSRVVPLTGVAVVPIVAMCSGTP